MLGHKPNVTIIRTIFTYPDIRSNPFSGINVPLDPFSVNISRYWYRSGYFRFYIPILILILILAFEFYYSESYSLPPSKIDDSSVSLLENSVNI